jgi:hypothetical protein
MSSIPEPSTDQLQRHAELKAKHEKMYEEMHADLVAKVPGYIVTPDGASLEEIQRIGVHNKIAVADYNDTRATEFAATQAADEETLKHPFGMKLRRLKWRLEIPEDDVESLRDQKYATECPGYVVITNEMIRTLSDADLLTLIENNHKAEGAHVADREAAEAATPKWQAQSQFALTVKKNSVRLGVVVTPSGDEDGLFQVVALETSATGLDGILDNHKHQNLGAFPMVAAIKFAEDYANKWTPAPIDDRCECTEIRPAVGEVSGIGPRVPFRLVIAASTLLKKHGCIETAEALENLLPVHQRETP